MDLTEDDVIRAVTRFRLARVIAAAATLDLASALVSGPAAASDVAIRVGADVHATLLLLRALASEGVFIEEPAGTFGLNEAARVLLPASAGGSREYILGWYGHDAIYRAMGGLAEGTRQGRPAFDVVHGTGFFEWLADHPDELSTYMTAVGGEDPKEFDTLMNVIDLSDAEVVADIGGGGGGFLLCALQRWPHLRGILMDLPAVIDRVGPRLTDGPHGERITCVPVDCVRTVPVGADVYVMTTVLRYFDDQRAAAVLGNVRAALAPTRGRRRLILSEMPVPEGPARAPQAMASLNEFALSGGQDRTRAELTDLLVSAGFESITYSLWKEPYWITEAHPRRHEAGS
jgi:hypothetical protein